MKRMLPFLFLLATPALAQNQDLTCETLWYERNLIFSQAGLCYSSPLGRSVFDNNTCTVRRGGDVLLSPEQSQEVARIQRAERNAQCRINTGLPPSTDLLDYIAAPQTPTTTQDTPPSVPNTEEPSLVVCSNRLVLVHQTPSANAPLVAGLINGTFLTPDPDQTASDAWQPIKGTLAQTAFTGWVQTQHLQRSCATPNDPSQTGTTNALPFFPIDPPTPLPVRLRPIEIGMAIDTPNDQANKAWFAFHWTTDCGTPPSFAFTREDIAPFRAAAQTYTACLENQAQQDAIVYELALIEAGITLEPVAWSAEPQPAFSWNCQTCQAHYEGLQLEQTKRETNRNSAQRYLTQQQQAFQQWLRLAPSGT